jgi:hypothetical protein
MPDISGLIAAVRDNQALERNSSLGLVDQVAQMARERGQRAFSQDAINFFKDGNISPERIQQFSQMYPNVDPAEAWKVAAAVGSQYKAQKMKDMFSMVSNKMKETGGKIDEKTLSDMFQGVDPSVTQEFMQHMGQNILALKALRNEYTLGPNDKRIATIGGNEVVVADNPVSATPKEKPRNIKMTDPTGKTVYNANENEAVLLEERGWTRGAKQFADTKKDTGLSETIYGPNGATKKVFIKKGEEYIPPTGWSLKSPFKPDKPDKPQRIPYRNNTTGAIKHFDKNNATDRAVLENEGINWTPVAEDPIESIIRKGVTQQQPTEKKDNFGYVLGQTQKGKDGKQYKYIGNDKWQRL